MTTKYEIGLSHTISGKDGEAVIVTADDARVDQFGYLHLSRYVEQDDVDQAVGAFPPATWTFARVVD